MVGGIITSGDKDEGRRMKDEAEQVSFSSSFCLHPSAFD
jgi:hypothetical protein